MLTRHFEERFLLYVDPLPEARAFEVLRACLDVFGEAMDAHGAEAVAALLPASLREPVLRGKGPQALAVEDVTRHLARELGMSEGDALEQAQVALEAFVRVIEPAALGRLKRELGEPLAQLLEVPERIVSPPAPAGHEHTLAAGRAGAARPMSDSAPAPGQAHSVVREANPHGASKLSGAQGVTQEREHETLATGKPKA